MNIITDAVKVGVRNVFKSSKARSSRCNISCRQIKAANANTPIINGPTSDIALPPPDNSPKLLSPKTMPPNPNTDKMTEKISIGTRVVMPTLRIRRAPIISIVIAIGSIKTNKKRQLKLLKIKPEIVGPIAGATAITIEIFPIRRPNVSCGSRFITVVISSGSIIAVPPA